MPMMRRALGKRLPELCAVAGAASHIEQLAGLFKVDAFDQIDGRLRPFGLEAEIGGGIPLHGVPLAG